MSLDIYKLNVLTVAILVEGWAVTESTNSSQKCFQRWEVIFPTAFYRNGRLFAVTCITPVVLTLFFRSWSYFPFYYRLCGRPIIHLSTTLSTIRCFPHRYNLHYFLILLLLSVVRAALTALPLFWLVTQYVVMAGGQCYTHLVQL